MEWHSIHGIVMVFFISRCSSIIDDVEALIAQYAAVGIHICGEVHTVRLTCQRRLHAIDIYDSISSVIWLSRNPLL
jgi:hypothetical protein